MINTRFEAYKIERELKRSGVNVSFIRRVKNAYNEDTDVSELVCTAKCLYHVETGYLQVSTQDGAQTRFKRIPKLLCLKNDVSSVKMGDVLFYNSKEYKVCGVDDVQEWGIVADISLEVLDNGNQF